MIVGAEGSVHKEKVLEIYQKYIIIITVIMDN